MKETTPSAMPPCFDRWCQRFDKVFTHQAQKREFRHYLGGLLGESERKNLSQMACNAVGVSYHRLHHFLTEAFTPNGGTAETITGVSNYQSATNTIEWDGTKTSSIIVTGSGFSFDTLTSSFNVYQNTGTGYLTATSLNYSLSDFTITSSNFAPVPFEFSPEQGFILGIPVFIGLRKLKKMIST